MDAFPYLLQTSTLLLVLSVGYYLLLRRETFFQANRLVLWLSLVGALLLPRLELPDLRPAKLRALATTIRQQLSRAELPGDSKPRIASSIEKLTIAPPTRQVPIMNVPPGNEPQVQLATATVPTSSLSWQTLLTGLYELVAAILLIRFLVQLLSLIRLINRSEHTDYEEFTLITNPSVHSPFSFFKWVALNPAQHTPDEQEQILRHERVHVRQWHSLDTLATEVLCILFWFNPGAWLFRRLVHQTLEYIADRAVLQEGINARAYQYNLVKVTLSASSPTISNHFSRSELKDRIRMINRRRSGWWAGFKYPLLAVLVLGVSTAFIQPKAVRKAFPVFDRQFKSAFPSNPQPSKTNLHQSLTNVNSPDSSLIVQSTASLSTEKTTPIHDTLLLEQARLDTLVTNKSKRYLHYNGEWLWWLVTPKTDFDDLSYIKKELAKYGYAFQANELIFDEATSLLTSIGVTVKGKGSKGSVHESGNSSAAPSCAGYINIFNGSLGIGRVKDGGMQLPSKLMQVIHEDEKYSFVTAKTAIEESQLVLQEKAMLDLVTSGKKQYTKLGNTFTHYARPFLLQGKDLDKCGLTIRPDGFLAVSEEIKDIPIFINNRTVNASAVNMLRLNQLHSVVFWGKYNSANEVPKPSAIQLYVFE